MEPTTELLADQELLHQLSRCLGSISPGSSRNAQDEAADLLAIPELRQARRVGRWKGVPGQPPKGKRTGAIKGHPVPEIRVAVVYEAKTNGVFPSI